MFTLCPVILCGGSGTRLWPISTATVPKQFISLGEVGTLLEVTLNRLDQVATECRSSGFHVYDPLLIMHHQHSLPSNLDYPSSNILYEPFANDTAVAVGRAAKEIKRRHPDSNPIMLVVPADHYIENVEAFVKDITLGIQHVTSDNIVLYGIEPTAAVSKYGYIIPSDDEIKFKEKPEVEVAAELIRAGAVWNSGIFAAGADIVLSCLHRANIMDWIDHPRSGKAPSFDVAVLQEYFNIYAQSCSNWNWSDVGSFASFTSIPEIQDEVLVEANVHASNCKNITVLNRSAGNIVTIGCENLYIIVNGDNILVMSKQADHDSKLKSIASTL